MCNLGEGIYEEAFEEGEKRGIERGIEQGIEQKSMMVAKNLYKQNMSVEAIAETVACEVATVKKWLSVSAQE